jgi:hypothetical protein
MFGFSILYNTAFNVIDKFIRQVDPSQQFSAPFKAGNSRQVQTCYKIQHKENLQHYLVHTSSGETGVLPTLNHRAWM